MSTLKQIIHPSWLRAMHWLNAFAVIVLIMSGWRIYNATLFSDLDFPGGITLGQSLAGALQWHLIIMPTALHAQTLLALAYDGQVLPPSMAFR